MSVATVIKQKPRIGREYLSRYEDAEVSRIKLLELQQGLLAGQPTLAEKVLFKSQKKRLKKRLRGKGGRITKGRRGESKLGTTGRARAAEDLEIERDKLRQEKAETERKERESDFQRAKTRDEGIRRDRELNIQDRTAQAIVYAAQLKAHAKDTASQREVWALQTEALANRTADAALQDRREALATSQIAAGHLRDRRQRGLEHRRLNEEARRFDEDVADRGHQRVADTLRHTRELEAVRQRVVRDAAERTEERRLQQERALGELAERGREREMEQQNERFRIETARAVDADRSESDREREATLQQVLNLLRHQAPPDFLGGGGGGGGAGGGGGGGELRREPSAMPELIDVAERRSPPSGYRAPPTSPVRRRTLAPTPEPEPLSEQRHQTASERLRDLLRQPATATPPSPRENPLVGRTPEGHYERRPGSPPRPLQGRELEDRPSRSLSPERRSERRWTRGEEPHREEERTPGVMRESPEQHTPHNVGAREQQRPEGLDRAGGGHLEDVANDGALGEDET